MNLQALIDKRMQLIADMRAIIDQSGDAGLDSEKEAQYNAMDTDQEKLEGQIEREVKLRDAEKRMSDPVTRKAPFLAGGNSGKERDLNEIHLRALRSYLIQGPGALSSPEFNELRSLNAGLVTEGGAFVPPVQFVNELIKAVDDKVVVRQLARTFQVKNAGSLGFPTLDADPADADWTTELATGSLDSSMATGLREFKPTPIAKLVKVSRKLLRTSVIPVEQLIRERLAYKFAITQEKAFMTGNGANKPMGLFTASSAGIPTSRDVATDNTTSAVTGDGLINALFSLKEAYWSNATWLFHRDTMKMIRKLKDSGTGAYLWQPGLQGLPSTILDRPYVISEYAPNTFTTGLYVGLVGDFSHYWIVDDIGTLEIQKLVELYAATNQDGFIGRMESDAMPVLGEAFARVTLA